MSLSVSPIERSGRMWSTESSASVSGEHGQPDQNLRYQNTSITDDLSTSLQGHDFMHLMSASVKHGVPSFEMRKSDMMDTEQSGQKITLGSGLTSTVVQYTMTEDDPVRVPFGRIVALKTFRRTSDSKIARQAVYECIVREMEILRHPLLVGHPNIVQLYFIGWQKGEAFPGLSMEHGAHGSLDYLVRGSWTELSYPQIQHIRQHITVDILMGLDAIHRAGFIHGDLKPENILVMSHPDERHRVVAKLTDFGGSSQLEGQDGGRPRHYTPLWCAPEVLNQDPDIDWEKADLYSYGLIIGSLWASEPGRGGFGAGRLKESSSCFLRTFIPSSMSKQEAETFLWAIKSQHEEASADSVISSLRQRLEITVPDEDYRDKLVKILTPVLRAHFWLRPSTQELARDLRDTALNVGRDTMEEIQAPPESHGKNPAKWQTLGPFAWSRSRDYVSILKEQAVIALGDVASQDQNLDFQFDLPDKLPDGMKPGQYFSNIKDIIGKLVFGYHSSERDWNENNITRGKIAFFVALSSLSYIESPSVFESFKDMMWASAAAGYNSGIMFASLALDGTHKGMRLPLRCLLSLLALSGSNRASEILYNRWPTHHKMVQEIIRGRPSASGQLEARIMSEIPFMAETLVRYSEEPILNTSITLQQASDLGLINEIREALDGTVVPDDFYESVAGLLHGLSNLPDSEAAALASRAYSRGAKLSFTNEVGTHIAQGARCTATGSSSPEDLSPLSAAISQGKSELALAIFCLHVEHDNEPIVDFDQALALSCVYMQHNIADLLLGLYRTSPQMCHKGGTLWQLSDAMLSELLSKLVHPLAEVEHLEARLLHGNGFDDAHERTVRVLLENGVDPTDGDQSALLNVLATDSVTTIKHFMNALEERGIDVLIHLKDPGNLRQHPNKFHLNITALTFCIEYDSIRSFEYLLQKYPLHFWKEAGYDSVASIVHEACAKKNGAPYVETLLRCGADCMARDELGRIPISVALIKGHSETADAISRHCPAELLREQLDRDTDSGWSVFFQVLGAWSRQRRLEMIDSFRWLIINDGLHLSGPSGTPFWFWILQSTGPLTSFEQRLDAELLDLLLSADKLSNELSIERHKDGSILHHAVRNGHVQIVRLILDRGFDPNIKMAYPGEIPRSFQKRDGVTPLDLACAGASSRLGVAPQIATVGYLEAQNWFDNMEEIRNLLTERGARSMLLDGIKSVMGQQNSEGGLGGIVGNRFPESAAALVGSWPKPVVERPAASALKEMNRQEILSNTRIRDEFFYDVMRSTIQQRQIEANIEAEQEATPRGYLQQIKMVANIRKHEWRLPPDWYCLIIPKDKADPGGHSALYANRQTGKFTHERPELYRGGKEAISNQTKGKEKAIEEEDIYNATPMMKPQLSPDVPYWPEMAALSLDTPVKAPQSGQPGVELCAGVPSSINGPQESHSSQMKATSTDDLSPESIASTKDGVVQAPLDLTRLRYQDGSTVLHVAAALGHLEMLSLALEQNLIPIDTEQDDGCTPLHAAVDTKKLDALALLMAYGADPNRLFPQRGHRPIHHSALQDSADMANVLIEGNTDVNATTIEGYAPLHFCVSAGGRVDILETLIQAGADVNAMGPEGSVLKQAVISRCKSGVKVLLNAGARIDVSENLLHAAVACGSIKIAKAILDKGQDVDQRDSKMQTPLIVAIVYQDVDIINLLCKRGACKCIIKEFQFFTRTRDDGRIDKMVLYVGQGNHFSAEEVGPVFGTDDGRWEEWEPIKLVRTDEPEVPSDHE